MWRTIVSTSSRQRRGRRNLVTLCRTNTSLFSLQRQPSLMATVPTFLCSRTNNNNNQKRGYTVDDDVDPSDEILDSRKGFSDQEYKYLFGASDNAGADADAATQTQSSSSSRFANQPRLFDDRQSSGSSSGGGGASSSTTKVTAVAADDIPIPLWTDSWEISDEMAQSKMNMEDIPVWSPEFVSRISMERVQILPGKFFLSFLK